MDRPLCTRCVYTTAFNYCITPLIFDSYATIYRRKD